MSTICSIGTPAGNAGISIIRISGPESLDIIKKISNREHFNPRHMYLETLMEDGSPIDKVLMVFFASPYSFTGEDVVEIHCHGGIVVTNLILGLVIRNGVRPSEPGEFSKRAFLNGKIDLSQAEAVADLIGALTEKGAASAAKQLNGSLSVKLNNFQSQLTDILAAIQAGIEYPEENLEESIISVQEPLIRNLYDDMKKLEDSYEQGKLMREGIRVAICGKPNVGKSSLLNYIIGEERAIVASIPGTTRDILIEYYNLKSVPIIFMDTAGIRKTSDEVESIGVSRAYSAIEDATITLFLLDSSEGITNEEREIYAKIKNKNSKIIIVLNKSDLFPKVSKEDILKDFGESPVLISVMNGAGIDNLLDILYNTAINEEALMEGMVITNARHKDALVRANCAIQSALQAMDMGIDLDCVTIDLNEAWQCIGEITGVTVTDDIIDRIFEKFCLGK